MTVTVAVGAACVTVAVSVGGLWEGMIVFVAAAVGVVASASSVDVGGGSIVDVGWVAEPAGGTAVVVGASSDPPRLQAARSSANVRHRTLCRMMARFSVRRYRRYARRYVDRFSIDLMIQMVLFVVFCVP
jgi:hypothetical protein